MVVVLALPVHLISLKLPDVHVFVWKFQRAEAMFIPLIPLSFILGTRRKDVLPVAMYVILNEHPIIQLTIGILVYAKSTFLVVFHLAHIDITIVVRHLIVFLLALYLLLAHLIVRLFLIHVVRKVSILRVVRWRRWFWLWLRLRLLELHISWQKVLHIDIVLCKKLFSKLFKISFVHIGSHSHDFLIEKLFSSLSHNLFKFLVESLKVHN